MAREITVQELAKKQTAGESVVLVDVRQPEEHAVAALPGSVLVPLNELPQRWSQIAAPAGTPVVVYCHHGIRSRMAANFLEQCGLHDVRSLAGGIDAWARLVDPNVPRY